ncbi:MAG: UDP-phosphate glucose phosphotransferase, partial [Brevundimonas sp.]|nr:UDP-phosphate glucose phosphotransferase [Brevundimonas sp.]
MTDAASRLSFDASPATAGEFDLSGLQALATPTSAERREEPRSKGAARRGPFRPEVWLNARQRHASRLAAHYFRAFDVLAVAAVTMLCAWAAAPGPLIHADVSILLPFVLGALTVLGLLRSLGRYRFARGQKAALHLASVAGIVAAGA